jgi:membrane-bound ClpP family serine protease
MNWSVVFIGVFIVAGWSGVLVEFVRPGWVLPGAAGGVLLIYGLARALPDHPAIAILSSAPFLLLASWMLAIARRARRNKRALQ